MRKSVIRLILVAVLTMTLTVSIGSRVTRAVPSVFNDVCSSGGAGSSVCNTVTAPPANPIDGPNGILIKAAAIIATLTGVASVIMIVIGGLKFIGSQGNPNAVSSARTTVLYAVIGLVVAASAGALILFIVGKL